MGEPPKESAESSDLCRRCGYPLTGLDDRVGCPECGLLVGLSRTESDELRHAKLGWIRRLIFGCVLLILAYVLVPGSAIVASTVATSISLLQSQMANFAVALAIILSSLVLLAISVTMITAKPAGEPIRPRRGVIRLLAWLPAIVYLGLATFLWIAEYKKNYTWDNLEFWYEASFYLPLIMLAAFPLPLGFLAWTLTRYLKELARRVPAPLLSGDSTFFGSALAIFLWIYSAFLLYVLTTIGEESSGELPPVLDIILAIVSVGLLVGGLTVAIWCWVLLIRYAIAFTVALRQARSLLAENDLSRHSPTPPAD